MIRALAILAPLALTLPRLAWADDPPPAPEAPPPDAIVEMPRVETYVEAPYPEAAKLAGKEAIVALIVQIDDAGKVVAVEVSEPAGYGFDEAAVEAVRQMTFTPARTASGPIGVAFEFRYGFTLETATTADPADGPPVNLEGTARMVGTRDPIVDAKVTIVGTDLATYTDAQGHFAFRAVPPGAVRVEITHPGYRPYAKALDVVEGEATAFSAWLNPRDDDVIVVVTRREEEDVTRRTLTVDEIRKIPGTFGDPVKVIQTLPGAARAPFGTGLLVIRGANPEDSGVYVDGIRIPLIYHLTGTTSVFSPEIVEAVDYLPGGYGAQFGRTQAGTIDVRTKRTFDDRKLVWGTDILDSQVWYEDNVGKGEKKHGIAFGARRSYIDALLPLFVKGPFTIRPVYWDYQAKWVPPGTDARWGSLFVYGFDDLLTIATNADEAAAGAERQAQSFETRYGSHRAVGRYHDQLTEDLKLDLTGSVGIDTGKFAVGSAFVLKQWQTVLQLRAEASYTPVPGLEIVPGLDGLGGWWKFNFASAFRYTQADDPLAERDPTSITGHGSVWSPDTYLKVLWRPLADRDRWLIQPQLRNNTLYLRQAGDIANDGAVPPYFITSWDPRFSTRFAVVPDQLWVKASTGFYHQPPQPQEAVGIGTAQKTGFERAFNTSFGVEHQVTPSIRWEAEGFWRELDRQIVFDDGWTGFGDVAFINAGFGRAYGVEVMLRHAKTGPFFGWISYTLSKAIRKDRADADWYRFDYDQTHIFSAQGGYELPWDLDVSLQVQYVTGNPITPYGNSVYDIDSDSPIPFPLGSYNADRLPSYFQTSLRFERPWNLRRWQVVTYVDLINAVRGVNPEFTVYNYDYTEHTYVRGLPFIPNIGVEAKFRP